uniref:Uncharacterized protein n=1 Tax=Cucumis melo TaxID=3656 RepID=A0A9I9DN45_CUCME
MSSPSPPPVPESTTRPPIPPPPIHHIYGDTESSQVSGTAAEETSEEIPADVKMG